MACIISILVPVVLCLAFIGMWRSNTDKVPDQELYGMDADEYLKNQVGENYFNKHYK